MSNRAEIIARFPKQKECSCGYKKCPPTLDGGCGIGYCDGDLNFSPLCNAIGITGLIDDTTPCILFDDQLGRECIGCKKDCNYPQGCPIYLPY